MKGTPTAKKILMVMLSICILLAIYLISIAVIKFQNNKIENYVWDDKIIQSLYATGDWQAITSSVDQGFRQKGNYTSDLTLPYKYWLAGPNGERIDDTEMLALIFTPIETPELAISMAAVQSEDIIIETDIPRGQVKILSDGYLVQLVQSNLHNCKPDVPNGIIYQVRTDGTVTKIAVEDTSVIFPWEMLTQGVCVD